MPAFNRRRWGRRFSSGGDDADQHPAMQTLLTEAILGKPRSRVSRGDDGPFIPQRCWVIEEIYALVDDLIAAHGDWLARHGYAVNLESRAGRRIGV